MRNKITFKVERFFQPEGDLKYIAMHVWKGVGKSTVFLTRSISNIDIILQMGNRFSFLMRNARNLKRGIKRM